MDPQSPPQLVNVPVQPLPQSTPPSPNKNPWTTIWITLVLLMGIAIGLLLGNKSLLLHFTQMGLAPTPTPTATPSPTLLADPTANWKTYTNPELGFSFRYPTENSLGITEFDVNLDSTALKPDKEIWVAYPNSDAIVLGLYLYKSNLSAQEWWNTQGINKYNKLVTDFYNVVNPKPPRINLPKFTISASSIGVQTALVAKGNVEAAQRGESIISTVSYNGWIYLFEQLNPLPNNKALEISNQILSTFKFSGQPTASNLKTYNDPILDLSFQYPSDWKLTTGSYGGDIALDGTGACNYINKSFAGYLKNPNTCSDATIKSFSPGLTLTSTDGVSNLEFAGPTSGLGGACPECVPNSPKMITITGKSYTLNTYTRPDANIKFSSLFPDQVGIFAGAKSVWNKFDIDLNAVDQATFDTEIGILQSITYSH